MTSYYFAYQVTEVLIAQVVLIRPLGRLSLEEVRAIRHQMDDVSDFDCCYLYTFSDEADYRRHLEKEGQLYESKESVIYA